MPEVDWADVRISAAQSGPVRDLWVDFIESTDYYLRWEAGAEMTKYSGSAVLTAGYWVIILAIGDTFRCYDLDQFGDGEFVEHSRWQEWPYRKPNPRTVLAVAAILRQRPTDPVMPKYEGACEFCGQPKHRA